MAYENNNKYAENLYAAQSENGAFKPAADNGKKPFVVMMPPPNVTGNLHVGHAFTMLMQDFATRYHRMLGEPTLWLPGTDHASIATQMLVEKQLAAEGTSRQKLGREKFLQRAQEWKTTYHDNIVAQLKKLGCSCDWSRESFTMDDNFSNAVEFAFIKMYEDNLIYRAHRLVNWDPILLTTVSDLEVDNVEESGNYWHIKYDIENSNEGIIIATTRPETLLGDTAIAVNPTDPRYTKLIGKFAIVPLVGRRIPIVADDYADKDKGTGAVKITPAHDFNDFAVGERNGLEVINVMDERACISEDFGTGVKDLKVADAREKIVALLGEKIVKVEPCVHQVPHSQRGGAVLEPRLTWQWFCDVSPLAARAIKEVETGRLKFLPDNWKNTWYSWLKNIQPWCISRQLWWGHQIPAYYDEAGNLAYVGTNPPAGLRRDEDVLDTWFSSGLWPMGTLGFPEKTEDFRRFFPNSALITGFDIIFFWVARMVMMSLYFEDKIPFETVVIHGLVTDENGQKMSKTKGNVINPIDMIDEFGIDAVRFAICKASNQNRFLPFGKNDVEVAHKFLTKLLNAITFWEMRGIATASEQYASTPLADWLLTEMNDAIASAGKFMDDYRYDEYANTVYHFIWDIFCDRFIELAKKDSSPATLAAAKIALKNILLMLQPIVPFIAAEQWERLGFGKAAALISENFATPTATKTEPAAARKWLEDILLAQKVAAEKASATKEIPELEKRIASLTAQLSNTKFTESAKPEVVQERRDSLETAQSRLEYLRTL